jgi:hypothetical protein
MSPLVTEVAPVSVPGVKVTTVCPHATIAGVMQTSSAKAAKNLVKNLFIILLF